ncbi:CMRF35-like molecule 1 [Brienomyrus brachyistius]|uniref:CMRF35-like molecule 1 n=1 Tax=Brienomyrus brachyistius TaxID=42636 RepID=UPI0020B3594E|nr:CMRF35-like molecule 1 [Brienomyrus brachyistius]
MDPLMLLFLLIAGLTGSVHGMMAEVLAICSGADSVSTVTWVSVLSGGSVTIPCFYEDRYETHVKYWCRGYRLRSCTPIVHTDSPQEGKVSVRDDPDQRVFTVTVNNLTAGDSGYYSCGVKIFGDVDVGDQVYLSVTEVVFTVKWVHVQRGRSVTIPCFYGDRYNTHVKYWCRGNKRNSCAPIEHTDSPQEMISIREDPDQRVFTVTINNLTVVDSGHYWCRVEISEASDPGDEVFLSVTEGSPELSVDKQEVTGVEGDTVSVQCRYGNSDSLKLWCKIWGSCSSERSVSLDGRPVLIRDDRVNRVFSVTMMELERNDTGWYWCAAGYHQIPVHITVSQTTTTTTSTDQTTVLTPGSASVSATIKLPAPGSTHTGVKGQSSLVQLVLYVGLGSLVLLLIIIIITWKVWDKHKKKVARSQNPGRTASEEPGADVTYSSIVLSGPEVSSRCSSHRPAVTPASDVIYSSVTLKHRE